MIIRSHSNEYFENFGEDDEVAIYNTQPNIYIQSPILIVIWKYKLITSLFRFKNFQRPTKQIEITRECNTRT